MNRALVSSLATGISLLSLVGCATNSRSRWVTNEVVSPSSLPTAVAQFVAQAGQKVGDPNPQIVSARTDVDDATQKPMYQLTITGNFVSGTHHAEELPMIVLADGSAGAFTDPNDLIFDKIPLFK